MLGDSVMNGLAQGYSRAARDLLAKKHTFILATAGCRRLIGYSCHIGTRPAPTTALQELRANAGKFDKVIVVAAGYNDRTTGVEGVSAAVDTFMAIAKAQNVRWVIWLTYREAGGPGNITRLHAHNVVLRAKARQYKNLRIADWAKASKPLPSSWFSGDGIHLGGLAAKAMAQLVSDAIDALPPMNRCDALFLTGRSVPAAAGAGALAPQSLHLLGAPTRLIDSRKLWGAVGGGRELVVPVAGVAGVPATAAGAMVTVTADRPCAEFDLKVHACGTALPADVLIHATSAATTPALVRLRGGALCVWTSAPTDLQVDLVGFTAAGAGAHSASSDVVLYDSRAGYPQTLSAPQHRLAAGGRLTLDLAQNAGVNGVQLDLHFTGATAAGRVAVLPGACSTSPAPVVSGRYSSGSDTSVSAAVRLSGGKICIVTEAATDVTVTLTSIYGVSGAPLVLS
jgi:hypothetical protein